MASPFTPNCARTVRQVAGLVLAAFGACDLSTDPAISAREPAAMPGQDTTAPGTQPTFSVSPAPSPSSPRKDEPSADGKNCGVSMHGLERVPPEVLLVLDRSGSMVENQASGPACASRTCGSRWDEVKGAIRAALARTQGQIQWGLKLYPDDDLCGVDAGANVPVGLSNAEAINRAIDARPPVAQKTHTPTRDAVAKGGAYLQARSTPNPKFLLLATDGEPNCLAPDKSGSNDRTAAVQAVADVSTAGVPVFVVGVATTGSKAHDTLNAMAMNGGRAREAADARYFPVGTSEELSAALAAIGAQVASCQFPLPNAPPAPENVVVKADGVKLPRDAWQYAPGMTAITVQGDWCQRIGSGAVKAIQAVFGCPGIVIE